MTAISSKRFSISTTLYRRSTPSVFHGFAQRNRGRSDREVKNAPAKELRVQPEAFSVEQNTLAHSARVFCSTGGEEGIRTLVGLPPNGFQDRLVMTTSILLRIFTVYAAAYAYNKYLYIISYFTANVKHCDRKIIFREKSAPDRRFYITHNDPSGSRRWRTAFSDGGSVRFGRSPSCAECKAQTASFRDSSYAEPPFL